ncbi:tetratricopeptide repeat protein [Candidatus Avelusimicrobium stercoris]|uniref:tetratricopeptide repeat protein n=1 Tax=Candidatus Avelusimicrobium stercoris TaxID=1947924 RepID=UPI003D0B3285
MQPKRFFIPFLLTAGIFILPAGPSHAFFPFSFGKQEIKTDYSQTVWDRMMLEQSAVDMRRGMGEMSQARYKEATDSFARAVIKNAKSPLPYLLLGASLYWSGKVEDAISEYKEAQRLDPKNPLSYQLLGIAAGWKGDVKQAQEYFLKANELDENKADTHMNLGSTYAVGQNWEKALEHFRRAVELAPQEPLYHYQLGTLYENMGRDEQAEASFKKALRLFPSYEDAQLSLGALEEKLNRPQEALKYYKKAVHTKPGDYVARLRYAFLLVKQGNKKRAREVLEEAFSITRFKSEGLALNAVYRASGRSAEDFKKQIEDFKTGLEKVSASKAVNIEVSLEYNPVSSAPKSTGRRGQTFEQAYQTLRAESAAPDDLSPRAFKRMFTLPEGSAAERQQQIDNLISGLEQAVAEGSGKYNVNLSMQGRTVDFASPSALTQNNLNAPKAVYDPRIVGNDMGLWVMGRTWIFFVDDAAAELQESLPVCAADNLCELLTGVAALARGNSAQAKQAFLSAQNKSPQDELPWLGLGTASVVAGQDDEARTHYERALRLAPKNKIAARNLKVLAE